MVEFRYLKYETKSKDEQKKIEDVMVEKMKKQKYEPSKLKRKASKILLIVVSHHWANAKNKEGHQRENSKKSHAKPL